MKIKKITLAVLLVTAGFMNAQDRLFTHTYQSNVLGKNQKEIEVWTDVTTGKDDFYRNITNRLEFEIGLGKNLQTAFYLNTKQVASLDKDLNEIIVKPFEIGFSNEWKYQISKPVADKIGSAVYLEYGFAPDEFEVELKAILDKRFGNSTHAINATYEPEWKITTENGKKVTEKELKYNFSYAYAYQLNNQFNLGFEAVNKNVKEGDEKNSALFVGPLLSYNTNNFWANLSVLPQVSALTKSGLNTTEFTKLDVRLIFSYTIN